MSPRPCSWRDVPSVMQQLVLDIRHANNLTVVMCPCCGLVLMIHIVSLGLVLQLIIQLQHQC